MFYFTDGMTASNRRSMVVDPSNKPPVPPTKAAAVAKIRETIAAAKRESSQDLANTQGKRYSVGMF